MLSKLKTLIITRLISPLVARLPANVWDDLLAREAVFERVVRKARRRLAVGRTLLADLFLQGEGLEIGAYNSPLPVPEGVRVRYVDYAPAEQLIHHALGVDGVTAPDIVDNGQTLSSIADSSQDFVIACHLIEHMEDPIEAVGNWLRVLKPGGILLIAIPDKRFTFDIDREVTPFSHLLRDHKEGPAWSRQEHYEDLYRIIYDISDEQEVKTLAEGQRRDVGHTHFHVWAQADMFEMMAALKKQLGLEFETAAAVSTGNEVVFALRKGDAGLDRSIADASLKEAREHFAASRPQAKKSGVILGTD